MNDSLRTDVFVRYSPETIACACIYLSARKLGIVLPKKPAWYLLFGCVEDDLKDICIRILKIYIREKVSCTTTLQFIYFYMNCCFSMVRFFFS